MGERLIPTVLKTVVPERVPGVRIPLPPPEILPDVSDLVHACPDKPLKYKKINDNPSNHFQPFPAEATFAKM